MTPEGMRVEAEKVRDLGFSGKGSVHPKQIAALNEVFTPSIAQIGRARRIINEFEKADTGLDCDRRQIDRKTGYA